jgi:hypothetical protein
MFILRCHAHDMPPVRRRHASAAAMAHAFRWRIMIAMPLMLALPRATLTRSPRYAIAPFCCRPAARCRRR